MLDDINFVGIILSTAIAFYAFYKSKKYTHNHTN
jgi:hypothetical protein